MSFHTVFGVMRVTFVWFHIVWPYVRVQDMSEAASVTHAITGVARVTLVWIHIVWPYVGAQNSTET
eukprot:3504632-Pyramimonas_sp.AAC.1